MAEPRDDELRARYRALATEEPPAALDDAIRAAARRAVGSAPGGARRSSTQRWAVPVSIAAVLFLSFGVVMHMQQEVPSVESELRGAPPASATSASAPAPATSASATPAPAKPAVAPPPPRKEKKAIEANVASAPTPAPTQAPAAQPAAPPAPELVKREAVKEALPASREAEKPDTAPAQSAPAQAAPSPRAFSDTAAESRALREERSAAPMRRLDEAGAASGGIAAPRAKAESFAAKPEPAPSVALSAPAAASPGLRAQGRIAASSTDRLAPWPDTPEKKLERIEELRKAGRHTDADEAIARFRREHPDYRIPEDVWNRIKPR